jgi:hypothetical protein
MACYPQNRFKSRNEQQPYRRQEGPGRRRLSLARHRLRAKDVMSAPTVRIWGTNRRQRQPPLPMQPGVCPEVFACSMPWSGEGYVPVTDCSQLSWIRAHRWCAKGFVGVVIQIDSLHPGRRPGSGIDRRAPGREAAECRPRTAYGSIGGPGC